MNVYVETYNRLLGCHFKRVEIIESELSGIRFFENENLNVVLQNWEEGMDDKKIIDETIFIRNFILRKNMNVWNTYYLICADEEYAIEEDMIYSIEREATALRKFMIRSSKDLTRIPFLDTYQENTDEIMNLSSYVLKDYEELSELINYIKQKNGELRKLKPKEIEDACKSFLGKEVKNEDR